MTYKAASLLPAQRTVWDDYAKRSARPDADGLILLGYQNLIDITLAYTPVDVLTPAVRQGSADKQRALFGLMAGRAFMVMMQEAPAHEMLKPVERILQIMWDRASEGDGKATSSLLIAMPKRHEASSSVLGNMFGILAAKLAGGAYNPHSGVSAFDHLAFAAGIKVMDGDIPQDILSMVRRQEGLSHILGDDLVRDFRFDPAAFLHRCAFHIKRPAATAGRLTIRLGQKM